MTTGTRTHRYRGLFALYGYTADDVAGRWNESLYPVQEVWKVGAMDAHDKRGYPLLLKER